MMEKEKCCWDPKTFRDVFESFTGFKIQANPKEAVFERAFQEFEKASLNATEARCAFTDAPVRGRSESVSEMF